MKNVLIVTALAGFIRSFLEQDIKILQNMGYRVFCIANKNHNGSKDIEEYFENLGVTFINVNFSSYKPISLKSLISYFQVKKIIKNIDFELIHVHTPIAGLITRIAARKIRKKEGCKVIYTTHGFYFHKYSSKKNRILYFNIEKFASKFCDLIVTINKEDYNNALSFKTCRVEYMPGVGVDINKFKNVNINRNEYLKNLNISINKKILLSIGELSRRKNHMQVLRAINKMKRDDLCYVICGEEMSRKGTKKELIEYAEKHNIDLHLLGKRSDIPEICKCADVGILPSAREGLGLAGLEMIAAGIPIIGSNIQGIRDYVSYENGYLYNLSDDADLIEKINLCLANNVKTNPFSILKFSIDKSFDKLSEIYKEVLK